VAVADPVAELAEPGLGILPPAELETGLIDPNATSA
jgi:hypothetical protein